MKTRPCALIALALLTGPALLTDIGVPAGPLAPRLAHAQDNVTKLAREKFIEGVEAYDKGRFEQARALFLQAYALKRHPAVLLNLGQSELKAGYVEVGGNHLQQFIRQHKTATAEQKQSAKTGATEAQKRTGFAIVIVDADGADVTIDGQAVGKAPLLDPYFVKPGTHEATATLRGKTVKASFTAKRGVAVPVTLNLGMAGVAPTPTPIPIPTPTPTPTTSPPAPGYPPPGPIAPTPMPPPGSGMPPADTGPDTGRENFFKWYTHKPVAWVLTGVTGVGLVGSIAFGAAAAGAASSADDVTAQIEGEVATEDNLGPEYYSSDGQAQPCGSLDNPDSAHPYYRDACNTLRDNLDARDADMIGMGVFIGVGVAAAAGVFVYYFIDTNKKSTNTASRSPIVVSPIITPDHQGVGLLGTF